MMRKNKKGDVFMLGLDIIFLVAIILIFWKLSAAFTHPNSAEGLGTRQTAVLNTYAVSEQMLLYLDEAAKFAAYESLAKTMGEGGKIAGDRTGDCKSYAGYELWAQGGQECFPQQSSKERADTIESFKKSFDATFLHMLKYPGFPTVINYEYRLDSNNGLTLQANTADTIRLPIIAAKDASQATITGLLQKENLIATAQGTFKPDTALPAKAAFSPNRKERASDVRHIIIHASLTNDVTEAVVRYTAESTQSVHYLIDPEGNIIQLVPENNVAFHMPSCDEKTQCSLGGIRSQASIEDQSIGIALVNPGLVPEGLCKDKERFAKLTRTSWCGVEGAYSGIRGATCSGFSEGCYAKYSEKQLAALKGLLVDIAVRRDLGAEQLRTGIRLEEQIRYASDNPGPAFTGTGRDGRLLVQKTWFNTLREEVIIQSAQEKAKASAPPAQSTPAAESPGAPESNTISVAWPVESNVITSCFGEREILGRHFHYGMDFRAQDGDIVRAIADGVVYSVELCNGRQCPASGNNVVIKHSENFYSRYSHLSSVAVTKGAQQTVIRKGDYLGKAGNTGSSESAHLDLKIYTGDPSNIKNSVNPLCIFPEELLQGARFGPGAATCRKAFKGEGPSRADPMLAAICANVTPHTSTPACGITTAETEGTADKKLALARSRLEQAPGLGVVQSAANDAGIDYRLLIALLAQESGGDPTILNSGGFVGLAQFGAKTARDGRAGAIFGSGINDACRCPNNGKLTACHAAEIPACAGDPRLNPEKSVRAAAVYLKWNEERFTKYTDKERFAIASYNRGAGAIQEAIAKTGKQDPTWEEVSPFVAAEGQRYVPAIAAYAQAQGYTIGSGYTDNACGGVSVKELGTYTFKPSFSVDLPDLFTAFDRTAAWAQEAYRTCDGSAKTGEDVRSCLAEQKAKFSTKWNDLDVKQSCDGTNESLVEGLAEAIRDCEDNLQYDCTCTWLAPEKFDGKNLTIDVYGNSQFQMLRDGVPLITDPAKLNTPEGTLGGRFKHKKEADIAQGTIRYTYLYEGGQLRTGHVETAGQKQYLYTPAISFYKPDDEIVWMQNGSGVQACGMYKTTERICVGIKRPVYVLSKGEMISPVIRFAMELNDSYAPHEASIPQVTQPILGGNIAVTFSASKSADISYYDLRCTPASSGVYGDDPDAIVLGRINDKPLPVLTGQLHRCNGLPTVPGTLYKVQVTPVDISAWQGEPSECNPQNNPTKMLKEGVMSFFGGGNVLPQGVTEAISCPLDGIGGLTP